MQTETIEKVREHVTSDHQMTIRILTNGLNISEEVVTQIWSQGLFEQGLRMS